MRGGRIYKRKASCLYNFVYWGGSKERKNTTLIYLEISGTNPICNQFFVINGEEKLF